MTAVHDASAGKAKAARVGLPARANDVIVASNAEGLFTYVSTACRALLGYTPAELIGKRMASFVHPEDVLRVLAGAAGAAAEASVRTVTARYRCKDGTYAWIDQRLARVTDADTGAVLEIRVVLRESGALVPPE